MPGDKLKFLLTYFLRRENSGWKTGWGAGLADQKRQLVRHLSAIPCKKDIGWGWSILYDFCKRTLKLTSPASIPCPIQTAGQAGAECGALAIIIRWCRSSRNPGKCSFSSDSLGATTVGRWKIGKVSWRRSLPAGALSMHYCGSTSGHLPSQQKIILY